MLREAKWASAGLTQQTQRPHFFQESLYDSPSSELGNLNMNGISEISSRFAALLQGSGADAEVYDRTLFESSEWVIAPTVGAIVPNWLLAIPRKHALSYRQWRAESGQEPYLVLESVCRHLGVSRSEILWFEHGPAETKSQIGCGIDHAHLHIILTPKFSFDAFVSQVRSMSDLFWNPTDEETVYKYLPSSGSYLVAGSGSRAVVASDVESTGSQFFRRVICSLIDSDDLWDYRKHQHIDNVISTIENFRMLESAARCD